MGTNKKPTPTEKAAILLISLGEDLAGDILKQMPQRDAQRILNVASRMGRIDDGTVQSVLAEFQTLLSTLKTPLSGGPEAARKLLKSVFPASSSGSEVDKFVHETPQVFRDAENIESKILFQIIEREHPQTISVILSHLSPKKSGGVLGFFPQDQRTGILLRMASMKEVDNEAIQDIAASLESALDRYHERSISQVGGIDKTAAILAAMGSTQRETLLSDLAERNPDAAAGIRAQLFAFEDIAKFDNADIEKILRKIPGADLEVALRRASDNLKNRIYGCMSERKAEQVRDNIASTKPIQTNKVEEAQRKIAQLASQMLTDGELRDPSEEAV